MKIQIKNRWDATVIFETDAETIGAAVCAAIAAKANLIGADLRSADLSGANLRSADLNNANLNSADLSRANLSRANLSSANLSSADLRGANLRSADLRSADLSSADLRSADLSSADLRSANLIGADLRSADLSGANLRSANLSGADLSGANLEKLLSMRTILPDGDLIGWKKLNNGTVAKLLIPAKAKRIGGLVGRKCRCSYAKVIMGSGGSIHAGGFKYSKGKTVRPDKFDPNPLVECSNGIHFFITKEEAEEYNL